MKTISKYIEMVTRFLNDISRVIIFAIMILVVTNIILRATLNSPIQGVYDILLMLSIIMVSMSIALCHLTDGHVNITILLEKSPRAVRLVLATIRHLLSIALFGSICWYIVFRYAPAVKASGETTLTTFTPLYPFYYIMAFGILFLLLVSIVKLIGEFRKEV